MAKKAYVGVENFTPRTLPTGYTQVEYIESSGTQYLDTGFKPNQDTSLELDVYFLESNTGNDHHIASVNNSAQYYALRAKSDRTGFAHRYYMDALANVASSSLYGRHTFVREKNRTSIDGGTETVATYGTFQITNTLPLCCFKGSSGAVSGFASLRIYSCKIYDNGTLVRDFVPCKDANGIAGLYDLVNNVFHTNAGSGAFLSGTINKKSLARQVKKIYLGVDNVAHKVKKAYVGVGGVARIWWTTGLEYNGTATNLGVGRYDLAGITIGNYALFGGGMKSTSTRSSDVDTYNASLTKGSKSLSVARDGLKATTVGNYAVFGGGYKTSSSRTATVDAFDKSLTQTNPTEEMRVARGDYGATSVGGYAIFAGGTRSGYGDDSESTIDVYDGSLTKVKCYTSLSEVKSFLGAASVGNYAVFAGGDTVDRKGRNTNSDVVNALDSSLSQLLTIPDLPGPTTNLVGVSFGSYSVFGSGYGYSDFELTAYNASLTQTFPCSLSSQRRYCAATVLDKYMIYGGGSNTHGDVEEASVDAFDTSFTRVIVDGMSVARSKLAAATVGSYALFAGGIDWSAVSTAQYGSPLKTVDMYIA